MGGNVRIFGQANPSTDGRHQAAEARFEEHLAKTEALMNRQRNGRLVAKAARAQRRQFRQEVADKYLRYVVSLAQEAAKTDPNRFGAFKLPGARVTYLEFITAARSMLDAAKASADVLATHGLGESVLADFEKAVLELEGLHSAVLEARQSALGATNELPHAVAQLTDLVAVLDGINRYRFADSPDRLAQWNSARNVVSPRTRGTEPVTPPVTPPATPPATPPQGGAIDKTA